MIRRILALAMCAAVAVGVVAGVIYYIIPVNRIGVRSELIMLGDLNDDNSWDGNDNQILARFLEQPFSVSDLQSMKIDVNRNGLIDDEDIEILTRIYAVGDAYKAETIAAEKGNHFPRPRELFKYVPKTEYLKRPLFELRHKVVKTADLAFLKQMTPNAGVNTYQTQLLNEIYNEGIRFQMAYDKRKSSINQVEKTYVQDKICLCNQLYEKKDYFNLLLNLIGLVEDAETLTTEGQSEFVGKSLYFRDDLKALLKSDWYSQYLNGKYGYKDVLARIDELLFKDMGLHTCLETMAPPRNFAQLSNYVERAEWQLNKSSANKRDMEKLLLYVQYDPRYLRAVSKTSRKNEDMGVENHNLPMVLLFRESLNIMQGNKKAAVGMLDEAIRIPFSWIKSIPREKLPKSIALENFLLPGNKEDGSDKSRHWNVFGGICLYKSPQESLLLALAREMNDLRADQYSSHAMTEFIRDTIADINGIYYVVSIDPRLVATGGSNTTTR
jgi:hypothetical protein